MPEPESRKTEKDVEQDAREGIREIILDLAPSPREPLDAGLNLVDDLRFNSLALLELAFSLEDEFELPPIDEQTARKILTVGDVEEHVLGHLRSAGKLGKAVPSGLPGESV